MIRHYFGSKAELFRATMGWPFEPAEIATRITGGDRGEIGERLTRVFFEAWSSRIRARRAETARRSRFWGPQTI